MNSKLKTTLIILGAIIGTIVLAFGGFAIYMNVRPSYNGDNVEFSAKKIGKTAYKEEKTIKINKHEFTYYNVKAANDGGWVLVDKTSYIINTDINFGFRFKSYDYVDISSYNGSSDPVFMCIYIDYFPGYVGYEVFNGFKLSLKENVEPGDGINIGILMHWC